MAEYEPCYVFTSGDNGTNGLPDRPKKRRKVSEDAVGKGQSDPLPLIPLLAGKESEDFRRSRYDSFIATWKPLEESLNQVLQDAQVGVIQEVVSYIQKAHPETSSSRIPTGLIVGGPSASAYSGLVQAVSQQIKTVEEAIVIQLNSNQASNLKSALKHINRQAANQFSDDVDGGLTEHAHQGTGYLNYDLQMLYDQVQANSIKKVLIFFQESESFNENLLADLMDILGSWIGRVPFVLLFSIATSLDLFEEKLSHSTVKSLQGTQFSLAQIDINVLFKVATSPERPRSISLGPGLSSMILQRYKDHVQSSSDFILTLKYLLMTYYFSDPLSILQENFAGMDLQTQHVDAIRVLPSFKSFAESLLDEGNYTAVQSLLDEDATLKATIVAKIEESRSAFAGILAAIETLSFIQSFSITKPASPWSELYIKAMSGELSESTVLREALLMVKKMPSDTLSRMLFRLSESQAAMMDILDALNLLIGNSQDSATPMRSEHDIHHNTLRTTVVAQKVELSKQNSALSKQDKEYSKIINRVDVVLREYFNEHLIDPSDLFLHEVLIYDAKSPYRDVFMPKPRFAVERALSSPHDYLGCNCCDSVENGLSATHPATAILYQLYLESGSLINTADLWSAFHTIVAAEDAEDEEVEQQKVLALFSRALAELEYFGMIKSSRKKADHLTKLSWKGL